MKKSNIIDAHNGLINELNAALESYKEVFGQEHPSADSLKMQLYPVAMNWGKDFLQTQLNRRQNIIRSINEKVRLFSQNQKFLATQEGKDFVESKKVKGDDIRKEIYQTAREFYTGFNNVLESIGLNGWEINARLDEDTFVWPNILPQFRKLYFCIRMKENAYADLNVSIQQTGSGCGWKMTISSSTSGETDITNLDEQYQQFKAYTVICEHAIVFESWMATKYCEMAHKCNSLISELDEIDDAIENPYDAWCEENK